jgi:hypothetical protein
MKYGCKITDILTGLPVDNCGPLQGRYKQVMLRRKQKKYQTVLLLNIFIYTNFNAAVAATSKANPTPAVVTRNTADN